MEQKAKKTCPICQGEKVIEGTCECNVEWRGTKNGDGWDDCQCTPDQQCSTCHGTGIVQSDEQE